MVVLAVALAGSVLLFVPGLLEQFETPKIELVRVCGLGALAFGVIAGRAGRPGRWSWLDRAVVAWLAVEVLATLLSVAPIVSVVGETRQREGLLTSTALAGLYFAARDAFARPGRLAATLDLVLALAALAGIYAVAQVLGLDPLGWRREATYAGGYVRPFATLGHPNVLGVLAAAAAALGLARAVAAGGGLARGLRAAAAALLVVVTVLTLTRAAWLGLAAGLLVAIVLAVRERGAAKLPARTLCIGLACVAVVVAIVLATGAGSRIALRFGELLGGGSGSSRLEIWRAALAAWRERPLIGHGPDLFEMVFPRFQTAAYWRVEWAGLPFHAHSIYLHTLATRGLAGVLAAAGWAVALGAAAVAAWRHRVVWPGVVPAAAGVLAACAVAGAFGALGITGALLVVVASAAVAAAAEPAPAASATPAPAGARRASPRRRHAKAPAPGPRGAALGPRTSVRRWIARAAAAVVAAIALLWGFAELRASRAGSAAQAFMTAAPERAVAAATYAVTLAPHDDRLWRLRAGALLWLTTTAGAPPEALAEAEAAARRAVALAPRRAENHIILGRALRTREANGDTAARADAQAEFRASLTLAPMDGLNLMEVAGHEAMLGRSAAALDAARRAVALYPGEGPAHVALARAFLAAGERDSARAALDHSLAATWRDRARRDEAERERAALDRHAPVGR